MSEQIYKEILNFKLRQPNRLNLKVNIHFRYRQNQPIGISGKGYKPLTYYLYAYIVDNLSEYRLSSIDVIDSHVAKSCTISLHPDKVGIARQNLPIYIKELVDLNFIVKTPKRGYDYYVNPYYCNTLSRDVTMHVLAQVEQLLLELPAQTSLFE